MLSAYSLCCGGVDSEWLGAVKVTLWHEGGCYHVTAYNHHTATRIAWDVFYTAKEARKAYRALCRKYRVAKR